MESLLGWPWHIVWVSELNIPPGSLWLYWHILLQGLVLVCTLFQLEPYNRWQDVSSKKHGTMVYNKVPIITCAKVYTK